MTEFRQDVISGQWVIIATGRARRPENYACKKADADSCGQLPGYVENCPFCAGNESQTPPEVMAIGRSDGRPPDSDGWRVRVVPNKYPALHQDRDRLPPARELSGSKDVLYYGMPGYGVHEVLIEAPEHNRHPGTLSEEQMKLVVESYYLSFSRLSEDRQLRFIQLFRNHGRAAGATIEHPHSQLVALPFVPVLVEQELRRAHDYHLSREGCPYCDLLEKETGSGSRVVADNEIFTAFMPYASRYPFETWIVPRHHRSSFLETTRKQRSAMASILGEVLRLLSCGLGSPPYNYYLHSAPLRTGELPHYHWHLEIIPKLSIAAGFEMGTGVYINVTRPEEAAHFIREKRNIADETWQKDLLRTGPA